MHGSAFGYERTAVGSIGLEEPSTDGGIDNRCSAVPKAKMFVSSLDWGSLLHLNESQKRHLVSNGHTADSDAKILRDLRSSSPFPATP